MFFRLAAHHTLQHAPHPAGAFATRRTLPATLMLVKMRQPGDGADNIGALVHDDHRRRAKARLDFKQRVEIHVEILAHVRRDAGNG